LDENNVCTSIKAIILSNNMLDQNTTKMVLIGVAVVLVILVVLKESKSKAAAPLGRKPRAVLGAKSKNALRSEPDGCDGVAIDSPDFARCATLGAGRTVLPGKPTRQAHNINTEFVQNNFDNNAGNLGNPFAMKIDDSFVKDDFLGGAKISSENAPISRSGGQAFPFSQSGTITAGVLPDKGSGGLILGALKGNTSGGKFQPLQEKPQPKKVPAPATSTARSSVSLGALADGVKFDTAFLGSAVSPVGADNLGASKEEIIQSAQQLREINVVQRTNGGQLNLLVHS